MAQNMTSRAKQALATKSKIYTCGVRLIELHGYDAVTVEQIARKANVSVGTYYHHFQSKFDLLVEIYRLGDVFFQEHVPALLREQSSCLERINAYFILYAQLSLDHGVKMTRNLYVPTNKMFITHGRAMQDLLTDILRQGQEGGDLASDVAPNLITEKLFIAARGVIFDWCIHDGTSDLIADMTDIISRLASTYAVS